MGEGDGVHMGDTSKCDKVAWSVHVPLGGKGAGGGGHLMVLGLTLGDLLLGSCRCPAACHLTPTHSRPPAGCYPM